MHRGWSALAATIVLVEVLMYRYNDVKNWTAVFILKCCIDFF
ncbi:MAG: hypothetical protein ACUVRK_13470 [Spirochaetota bacterium]